MKIAGEGAGKNSKEIRDKLRSVAAACVRHISYIYERAVRRFPNSMDLWTGYISFLKSENAVKALNSVFGRVISLHPKKELFWIEAAVHELKENSNAGAARVLLQRGLRANKQSRALWKRYFQLELWYAARTHKRRQVLDLDDDKDAVKRQQQYAAPFVVFKHAVKAIKDVQFACELHVITYDLSKDLSVKLEKELVTRFPTEGKLWEHMLLIKIEKILQDAESASKNNNGGINSITKKTLKKNIIYRGNSSCLGFCQLLEVSCHALNECADMLTEVLNIDNRMEFLDSLARSIQLVVKRIKAFNTGHLKEGSVLRNEEEIDDKKEVLQNARSVFQKLDDLLLKLRVMSNTFINRKSSQSSKHNAIITTYPASVLLAHHSIYNLLCIFDLVQTFLGMTCVEISSPYVFEWLTQNQNPIKGNEWVVVADTVLESALEESELAGNVLGLRHACETISSRVELLTETTEGCGVLTTLYEIMDTINMKEELLMSIKRAINSSKCLHRMRGVFCSLLVKMATKFKGKDEVVTVYEEVEEIMSKRAHLLANAGMEHFYKSVIQLVLEECEITAVGNKNEADYLFPSRKKRRKDQDAPMENNASSKITVSFGKMVVKRAISVCPADSYIWDSYETIESWTGNHKNVSHLKWKRLKMEP